MITISTTTAIVLALTVMGLVFIAWFSGYREGQRAADREWTSFAASSELLEEFIRKRSADPMTKDAWRKSP